MLAAMSKRMRFCGQLGLAHRHSMQLLRSTAAVLELLDRPEGIGIVASDPADVADRLAADQSTYASGSVGRALPQ